MSDCRDGEGTLCSGSEDEGRRRIRGLMETRGDDVTAVKANVLSRCPLNHCGHTVQFTIYGTIVCDSRTFTRNYVYMSHSGGFSLTKYWE